MVVVYYVLTNLKLPSLGLIQLYSTVNCGKNFNENEVDFKISSQFKNVNRFNNTDKTAINNKSYLHRQKINCIANALSKEGSIQTECNFLKKVPSFKVFSIAR